MNNVDHVLVARLVQLYDSWSYLKLRKDMLLCVDYVEEEFKYLNDRDLRYHLGRINYFATKFSMGEKVEPISLDNHCSFNQVWPQPIVVDGHHRLCGADLAQAKKIPTHYSGRIDLLRYLKGLRKTKPDEVGERATGALVSSR